jgi:CRP/FNR family transcriptional regulator
MESTRHGSSESQAEHAGRFFSKLNDSSLEDCSAMEYPSSYAANVVLFTEKEPLSTLFVIIEGEIRISINFRSGRRMSMRVATKGDIIELSSTLTDAPCDMTVDTQFFSKITRIERREFLSLCARHPNNSLSVAEELGRQITLACSQLYTLGHSCSAHERLARLMLE